jgi:hypothetical protein
MYKPNIENMVDEEDDEDNEQEGSDESEIEDSDESENETKKKDSKKPEVFKAAKLNPMMFEDKETKKQRR